MTTLQDDDDTSPPLPHVTSREAIEAVLDPDILERAARAAEVSRRQVVQNLRDVERVGAFRDAVATAVASGVKRVIVLNAGGTAGALAIEAVRAGATLVVAFEPDPTLAELVRQTASQTLKTPSDRNRLIVLETDVSNVKPCDTRDAGNPAWSVRTSITGTTRSTHPGMRDTNDTFTTERGDLLVLDSFAVANAVGVLDCVRYLERYRDAGVFAALLNPTHTCIPHSANVFAQLIGGSNLGDAFCLRDVDSGAAITRPCLGTGGAQIETNCSYSDDVRRLSDVMSLTCGGDSPIRSLTCRSENVTADILPPSTPNTQREARAVLTWWSMDIGTALLTCKPDDLSSNSNLRPCTVTLLPEVLQVPGENETKNVSLTMKTSNDDVLGKTIFEARLLGEVPDQKYETDMRDVDKNHNSDSEETVPICAVKSNQGHSCGCAAHVLWGINRIVRWNDFETNTISSAAIQKAVKRTGANLGAVLDLSSGPLMSVLAARALKSKEARAANLEDNTVRVVDSPNTAGILHLNENPNNPHTVLCVERSAEVARFSRAVLTASNVSYGSVKVAALDRGTEFFGGTDAIPILEPIETANTRQHTPGTSRRDSTHRVRIGAGASTHDRKLLENQIDCHNVAHALHRAAVKSEEAKEMWELKYQKAVSNLRKVFIKAVKSRRVQSPPRYGSRCDANRYDDGYARYNTWGNDGYGVDDWNSRDSESEYYDSPPNRYDAALFDAYCDRDRVQITQQQMEQLGFGGVDLDEIESDRNFEHANEKLRQTAMRGVRAAEKYEQDLALATQAKNAAAMSAVQELQTLRGAAERALGKMPAWVFLCDPLSIESENKNGDNNSCDLLSTGTWGDANLAELIRRRIWARRSGVLHVNFIAVPHTAVVFVVPLSCPTVWNQLEGETDFWRGDDGDGFYAERNDDLSSGDPCSRNKLRTRVQAMFCDRSDASSSQGVDETSSPFRCPIPTSLCANSHRVLGPPVEAMRVDLSGDGYDADKFSSRVEYSRNKLVCSDLETVDAFGFWIEYDTGAGWVGTGGVLGVDTAGVDGVDISGVDTAVVDAPRGDSALESKKRRRTKGGEHASLSLSSSLSSQRVGTDPKSNDQDMIQNDDSRIDSRKEGKLLSNGSTTVGIFILPKNGEMEERKNDFELTLKFDACVTTGKNLTVRVVESGMGEK